MSPLPRVEVWIDNTLPNGVIRLDDKTYIDLEAIRQMIREEVHRALHPEAQG
jgi:hypothetical protein